MADSAGLEMNWFGCLGVGYPVKVLCKGEATCAFSIIANLCYHLTDNKAGDFLKKEQYTSGIVLVKDYIVKHENWDGWMNS
eukprot:11582902-Ditylum_brightwellii.AAC.1